MEEASAKLEQAASDAYDLIAGYAEYDPYDKTLDASQNPWHNPEQMYAKLDVARNSLTEAWEKLETKFNANQQAIKDQEEAAANGKYKKLNPEEFRALYIDMITDAFADSLEAMREQEANLGKEIDVDVLVDCLQSGMELLDAETERGDDRFFQNLEPNNDEEGQEEELGPTIHQLRQLEVGYKDVSVSS